MIFKPKQREGVCSMADWYRSSKSGHSESQWEQVTSHSGKPEKHQNWSDAVIRSWPESTSSGRRDSVNEEYSTSSW